jgi:hypothetical protein
MLRTDISPSRDVELAPVKWVPQTDADRQAIRQQLECVLESLPFKTSKRCPALLNHVVEKTLQGQSDDVKERTLGIEVFHRDPQYDMNADPVVRLAAGEVRKRLAQYYYHANHRREIRIEMPSGSYVPEFYRPADDDGTPSGSRDALQEPEISNSEELANSTPQPFDAIGADQSNKSRWRASLPISCLILGLLVGAATTRMHSGVASAPITALDEFWRPLISAPGAVWLCLGQAYAERIQLQPNGARNRFDFHYNLSSDGPKTYPTLNMADTIALANMAGLLQSRNKSYSVHGASETTFSDLASGPSVLIGSFNNDWTIHLSDQLRFHFEMDRDTKEQWIVDREKPNEKIGIHSFGLDAPDTSDAYAIISRVRDPGTGQMVVALAGVSTNGTKAAGTFVSDPDYLEDFAKRAPGNWQNGNLQIVISAPIVDGSLGRPHVVSSFVW